MVKSEGATEISGVGSAHLLQLFDSDQSLADSVSAFLCEGLRRNHTVLAVMDEERWYSVAMRIAAQGLAVDEAMGAGRLIVYDAADTLRRFMRNGWPDKALFEEHVGGLIGRLALCRAPLRVYGEMVNVLAERGEYRAAHELEELWNDLGRQRRFRLFCGYMAAHFGDPRHAGALRKICASHSHVLSSPRDVLGSFLLHAHRVRN